MSKATQPTSKKTRARAKATDKATPARRKTSAAATLARDWKADFLTALAKRGNISDACTAAQIHRSTAYHHQQTDEAFAAAWLTALDEGADALEAEAQRRAVSGLVRKKFTKDGDPIIDPATGKQYVEKEYSDTLLIFLLKGARPEKYRDRIDHDHHFDKPIQFIEVVNEAAAAGPAVPPDLAVNTGAPAGAGA